MPARDCHLGRSTPSIPRTTLPRAQRNLEPKNKDRFTQNLTVLRHEYRSKA